MRRDVRLLPMIGLLLLNLLLGFRCTAAAHDTDCFAGAARRADRAVAVINPSRICVPEDMFVAIRKGRWKGVARFIELRDLDVSQITGCARYEAYTLDKRTGQFAKSAGVVSSYGSVGVHPIVAERGAQTVRARGLAIRYAHPGCLSLMADREIELALTPWRTLAEVNVDDERLQWFSFDPSGTRRFTISRDELEARFD